MPQLKIAIGVGGRFHADVMARALLDADHDVTLFTSLPKSRFPGLPHDRVRCCLLPEVVFRGAKKLGMENQGDSYKQRTFGRFLAQELSRSPQSYDLLIAWSSFGLEAFQRRAAQKLVLIRDSAHIDFQYELLRQEYQKFKVRFPERQFCVDRERQEYQLADQIMVLSDFAKQTFLDKGISPTKIHLQRLGVDTSRFCPDTGRQPAYPLRVVYFGSLNLRKGVHYLLEATKDFSEDYLRLYLAGPVEPSFKPILKRYPHARCMGPMEQTKLAKLVREMDLFVLPTLEDGFGQTLFQAMASGVVPITTEHCGAAELIEAEKSGLLIPCQDVTAILAALNRFLEHPEQLAPMREQAIEKAKGHHWAQYKKHLCTWVQTLFELPTPALEKEVDTAALAA